MSVLSKLLLQFIAANFMQYLGSLYPPSCQVRLVLLHCLSLTSRHHLLTRYVLLHQTRTSQLGNHLPLSDSTRLIGLPRDDRLSQTDACSAPLPLSETLALSHTDRPSMTTLLLKLLVTQTANYATTTVPFALILAMVNLLPKNVGSLSLPF